MRAARESEQALRVVASALLQHLMRGHGARLLRQVDAARRGGEGLRADLTVRHERGRGDAEQELAIDAGAARGGRGDGARQLREVRGERRLRVLHGQLHLRPVPMGVEEAMGAVDLIGQPPGPHEAQPPGGRLLVGGFRERDVKLERIEREPDERRLAIDRMNLGGELADCALPCTGIVGREM